MTDRKRVLLKLSGEALMGDQAFGVDPETLAQFSSDIAAASSSGAEIAVVVGGGNIFRGVSGAADGLNRAAADRIGMLATVMNGLALAEGLRLAGAATQVMSATAMPGICEVFERRAGIAHLEAGCVLILVAGTGNPYFTTDTAAVLRGAELECDAVYKATQVDGVYSADPLTNPDAERLDTLSYREAIDRNLKVMDLTAIALAGEQQIPLIVFNVHESGAIRSVIAGKGRYSMVH